MTHPEPFRHQPPPAPPGTYAKGGRSPIAYVRLCPPCAGHEPITPGDYWGALSGVCQGCGGRHRELHRFPAVIDSAAGCGCTTSHPRVTGDLPATADTMLARAAALVAAIEEHIDQRAEDRATPLIEDAAEKARGMVAETEREAQRWKDANTELRRRLEPLQRFAVENRDAVKRLAGALGHRYPSGRSLPSLVAEIEARLAKESTDG